MLRKIIFFVVLLILFFIPSISHAQVTRHNEYLYSLLPVSDSGVANAGDYNMYLVTTGLPSNTVIEGDSVANYLRLDAGWVFPNHFNPFMHAGIYATSQGVGWFAGSNPGDPLSPTVTCSNEDYETWLNPSGQPTGCRSPLGDLQLNVNIWTRVQLVTYGQGEWIVRFTHKNGHKVDVATIHNPYTTLTHARVVMEEVWYGTNPSQNPWFSAQFYDLNLKYRTGNGWAFWPSKFEYQEIAPFVFKLKNKQNDRWVSHNNGTSCTEADKIGSSNGDAFRYVSW